MFENERTLMSMRWGNMGGDFQLTTINARAETLTSKAMWSKLLPTNRCAVVANGYFEWTTEGGKKKPHFVHHKDKPLMVMAGLYEKHGDEFHYAVITTRCAKDIGWLHDRMPVILDTEEKIDLWISGDYSTEKGKLLNLLQPLAGLECYAVPEIVNSFRNDSADCLRELDDFKKMGGIAAFFQASKESEKQEVKSEPNVAGQNNFNAETNRKENNTVITNTTTTATAENGKEDGGVDNQETVGEKRKVKEEKRSDGENEKQEAKEEKGEESENVAIKKSVSGEHAAKKIKTEKK